VIAEPPGGAHRDPELAAQKVGEVIAQELAELRALSPAARLEQRYRKFRKMGAFIEGGT
jgi:acetyl-CoA carboxylase carboxyl transferase subunit alpha